jgi:hypothetical protein
MILEDHRQRRIALRAALNESGSRLDRAHRYDVEPQHRGGFDEMGAPADDLAPAARAKSAGGEGEAGRRPR